MVLLASKIIGVIIPHKLARNEKTAREPFLGYSGGSYCSGGKTRTYDLWVMSPTSYQLLHPAILEAQK